MTTALPVIIVTALYALQTAVLYWQGDKWGAIIFLGYAIANIGVIAKLGMGT